MEAALVSRPASTALDEIVRLLAARRDELNDEIRTYPSPIARCDVQLGALIEERSRIIAALAALRN